MHEMVVGLHISDALQYQKYRDAIQPLLARSGGGFRYDFWIKETLISESVAPINRIFVVYFANKNSADIFFNDPEYRKIKDNFFELAVDATTIIASYESP